VASLNTHDTPLFAAFWQDKDIEDRIDLRLLDEEGARREATTREARKQALLTYLRKKGLLGKRIVLGAVLSACLTRLRRSRAGIVLVNLEDLWLEREPQNVPGSGGLRANWTRKLRFSIEELSQLDGVNDTLKLVNSASPAKRDH
jgi:4-alpha-glucanotransferase